MLNSLSLKTFFMSLFVVSCLPSGGKSRTAAEESKVKLEQAQDQNKSLSDLTSSDVNSPNVLVEKRGHIFLIGINRADQKNRIDPATYEGLARAFYKLESDPELWVGVLYGVGDDFCMGLDVTAWAPVFAAGPYMQKEGTINPLGQTKPRRNKPLVIAVQGNTKFMGHEFFLASDIRVAAENTRFSQAENAYAVFPGGGASINFVREAGWGRAMYHMLLADDWGVTEATQMGLLQVTVPLGQQLDKAIEIAEKISRNAPLAIRATLSSANTAIYEGSEAAFAGLMQIQADLLKTQDFAERVKSVQEGRSPVYQGK